jgi:hypothetical protein
MATMVRTAGGFTLLTWKSASCRRAAQCGTFPPFYCPSAPLSNTLPAYLFPQRHEAVQKPCFSLDDLLWKHIHLCFGTYHIYSHINTLRVSVIVFVEMLHFPRLPKGRIHHSSNILEDILGLHKFHEASLGGLVKQRRKS